MNKISKSFFKNSNPQGLFQCFNIFSFANVSNQEFIEFNRAIKLKLKETKPIQYPDILQSYIQYGKSDDDVLKQISEKLSQNLSSIHIELLIENFCGFSLLS